MTNEEAIGRIQDHMSHHGIGQYPHLKLKEAFEIAIQALRKDHFPDATKMVPLTMEQLREMDEPVWVACKLIEGGNGYWCLCRYGYITTPGGAFFEVGEIPHWVFYRRPPEGEDDTNA